MTDQSLQQFVASVNGESHLRVEHDFGDGFVRLRTSEAERRQAAQDIRNVESIVLELLRNSRDAHSAHVFVAVSREGDKRLITVIDDGEGIPPAMHGHVFEPRVTSKLDTNHMDAWGMHGRGMALYSIKVNAEHACVMDSAVGLGCSVHVTADTRSLPERADQSSFPTFELTGEGNVNVRGPRNILRTTCEFAIESRDSCQVYIGSPVEVAATLYAYGLSTVSSIDRVFCRDAAQLPIVKRLATTADPETFAQMACDLGLDLSTRSARRILDGDIAELDEIKDRISIQPHAHKKAPTGTYAAISLDNRSFKLSKQDAAAMSESVKAAFADIAERYFLESDVEPIVKSRKDRLTITIPIIKHP